MSKLGYTPKVWGETACVIRHPVFSVHHIRVWPGGYCSVHRHAHRVNLFHVLSGELVVHTWSCMTDRPVTTLLRSGEQCAVPAGMYHKFLSGTGADVLEIYYPILPQDDDIERITEGGRSS